MRRDIVVRALSWTGLILLVALAAVALSSVVGGEQSASAADQPAGNTAQPAAGDQKVTPAAEQPKEKNASPKEPRAKKGGEFTGRLPAYFSGVITEDQRQKIYAIQKDFVAKIRPLRRQIESLTKERDEQILALLTPDQKQKIEALKAAAKKGREAKKDAQSNPAKPEAKTDKSAPPKKN